MDTLSTPGMGICLPYCPIFAVPAGCNKQKRISRFSPKSSCKTGVTYVSAFLRYQALWNSPGGGVLSKNPFQDVKIWWCAQSAPCGMSFRVRYRFWWFVPGFQSSFPGRCGLPFLSIYLNIAGWGQFGMEILDLKSEFYSHTSLNTPTNWKRWVVAAFFWRQAFRQNNFHWNTTSSRSDEKNDEIRTAQFVSDITFSVPYEFVSQTHIRYYPSKIQTYCEYVNYMH